MSGTANLASFSTAGCCHLANLTLPTYSESYTTVAVTVPRTAVRVTNIAANKQTQQRQNNSLPAIAKVRQKADKYFILQKIIFMYVADIFTNNDDTF